MIEFSETAHPIFWASSALKRRELRSKGGARTKRRIFSYAQSFLQISSVSRSRHGPLESMEIPTEPPTADPRPDEQRRRNLLQQYEQQFAQLSDDQKLSKLCSDVGLKTDERGQYFITLDAERPSGMLQLCREYTLPRNDPRTRARGWIRGNTKIDPVLSIHVRHHEGRYCMAFQVRRPRMKSTITLTPTPFLYAKERGWPSILEVMIMSAHIKSNDQMTTTSEYSSEHRRSSET